MINNPFREVKEDFESRSGENLCSLNLYHDCFHDRSYRKRGVDPKRNLTRFNTGIVN